jgi:hypothetical protein
MDPFIVAIDTLTRMPGVLSVGVVAYRNDRAGARVTVRRYGAPKFLEFSGDSIADALNRALRELGRDAAPATGTDG